MASDADVRPDRRAQHSSWAARTIAAVCAAAAAVLPAAPAGAEPSSVGEPDLPLEVPIPGGFRGFSEILRFVPPAPPVPQMPLGRPVPPHGGISAPHQDGRSLPHHGGATGHTAKG